SLLRPTTLPSPLPCPLSLHDALPILPAVVERLQPAVVELEVPVLARRRRHLDDQRRVRLERPVAVVVDDVGIAVGGRRHRRIERSEEHTSELQSREKLVCRLLLEKKK